MHRSALKYGFLLCLFLLPACWVKAQHFTPTDTLIRNEINLDLEAIDVWIGYKGRIGKKLFLGYSFGTGFMGNMSFTRNPYFNSTPETFGYTGKHKFFVDYIFSRRFHIDAGVTHGFMLWGRDALNADKMSFFAFEFGIFHKLSIFEIGIKPALTFAAKGDKFLFAGASHSFLTLRVPLARF
ncbi:MAG: hypothetical protein JNL13_00160 [Chitinophagaceae bacterium]|nr:hypothetical protein [Chitinophagaceae bacterium]